jgi:hypothetical protein
MWTWGGGSKRTSEGTSRAARETSIDEALGPSSTPPRGCGGGSAKSKAAQILSDTLGAISPHMR